MGGKREGEGWRGMKTEEDLGYGNLGQGCPIKKGKRTAKHKEKERKKIELTGGKGIIGKEHERCDW